jgi:CheY-like chemotaxis protein
MIARVSWTRSASVPTEAERGSRPTVLLAEDEPALRRLVVLMLQEHGYEVLEAANGGEALELAERHDGPVELLLTDVVMPAITGPELAKRLRGVRPGINVLFMSGYNDRRSARHDVEQGEVGVLLKPFTPDELLARVAAATGAQAQRGRPGCPPALDLGAIRRVPERRPESLSPSLVFMTRAADGPRFVTGKRTAIITPSME